MVRNMHELSAIVLVINGTKPRLTINVEYVLGKFRHQLPNAVLQNIFVILTNCNKHQVNFKPESIGLSADVHVLVMQNSAFSTDPSCWTPIARRLLQIDWENSMDTINSIVELLLNTAPITTVSFNDMNEQRNDLISLLHESRLIIMQLQSLDDALETCMSTKRNEAKYQFFEITHVDYHNTICSKCHQVCHDHCQLDESRVTGSENLKCCKVFLNGTCTVCNPRCSYKLHYHGRKLIVPCSRGMFDYWNSKVSSDQAYNIQQQQLKITENLHDQLKTIENYCLRLVDMCSGFNVVDELYTLLKFLEGDISNFKSEKVRTKARAFLTLVTDMCSRISQHQKTTSSLATPVESLTTEDTTQHTRKKSVILNKTAPLKNTTVMTTVTSQTKPRKGTESQNALNGASTQKKTEMMTNEKLARQPSVEATGPTKIVNEGARTEKQIRQEFQDTVEQRFQEATSERFNRQLSVQELTEEESQLLQWFRLCSEQNKELLLTGARELSKF
ncbi:unnamed protein product [Didymodactylos carnosus]|uniref:Uncharacterized protein n=1 Tax=Didymodactylos carnosus TaxID=1234261 RepID=A0A815J2H5_9BILA|nr:unnamed protein product [Didymodactylos carnosus]CAF1376238.1 unnamed protein product [Didymodactylos carnosus]CAF4024770.1 unnamed protein product [Didymodactylos carnosus]CAF4266892.1 unnamed protein product [Didymodactylos carnosus]